MFRKAMDGISKKDNSFLKANKKDFKEDKYTEPESYQEKTNENETLDVHLSETCAIRVKPQSSNNEVSSKNDTSGNNFSIEEQLYGETIPRCLAAQAVNLFYTYEKPAKDNYVLKGVNMNVMKGEIYALLGPSGCGKTTVLKCITQSIIPHNGEVWISSDQSEESEVFGTGIGFMPQELSMFPELSIQETLWLFGRLYDIPSTTLLNKIDEFSKAFELPPRIRRISQLSGGQKRRVSFVAALLRDAPLLILDEPTVGLDPILRQTIWNYLIDITSNHGKTVLLTTHYIDEAKDATTIGLMRDGLVLAEACPSDLMRHFNESSLEQCFYKICVSNENDIDGEMKCSSEEPESQYLLMKDSRTSEISGIKDGCRKNILNQKPFCEKVSISSKSRRTIGKVGCLVDKNIKMLKRSLIMVAMQFAIPGLVVALFGICIGEDVLGLKAAIINEEDPPYLSQQYLSELNSFPISQRNYDTFESAMNAVRNGEALVAVHFDRDFSYCLLHRFNLGIFVNNATVNCSTVKLHMDTTNQILSLSLQNYLIKAFQNFHVKVLKTLDATPEIAQLPVMFEEPVYGSVSLKYRDYVTPSSLLLCIHYLAALFTAISLIMERDSGIFERLQISGVIIPEIVAAQIITNFLVVLVQVVLMLIVQFGAFEVVFKGNMFLLILIIVLQGISGSFFGFFISSVTKKVNTGVMIGLGAMYPNLVLCGFIWPLEGMPRIMKKLAYFVPLSLTIESIRSLFTRGWGIVHQGVWLGFLSVVLWSGVFLLVGIIFYKFKK